MTSSASGILICHSCKARASAGARTCQQCGARLRTLSGKKPRLPQKDPLFGQQVGGYLIREVVGLGGMSRVYRAEDPETGFPAAIKILSTQASGDPHLLERFFKEAEVINQLYHPNIVEIYDIGVLSDGRPYIIMELLEGETLDKRLVARERLEETEAAAILIPVCEALSAAHRQGITHRDLKPENIFLPKDEQNPIKVLDFGVAKLHGTDSDIRQTKSNMILGTPQYMAPEQARTPKDVDERIDIYALGVILFELLTGRLPFMSASAIALLFMHQEEEPPAPSSVVPGISPAMDQIVLTCLEKRPDRRYQQAQDLANALRGILEKQKQAGGNARTLEMSRSPLRDMAEVPPEVDIAGTEVEIDIRSLPPEPPAPSLPPLPLPTAALSAPHQAVSRATPPPAPVASPPASPPPPIANKPPPPSPAPPPPVILPPPRFEQGNDLFDPIPKDIGEESEPFAPTPSIVKLLPSPMSQLRQKVARFFSKRALLFSLGVLGVAAVVALVIVLLPKEESPPPLPPPPPVYETPTRSITLPPSETQKAAPDEVALRLKLRPKEARVLVWVDGAPFPSPEGDALNVPKGAEVELVIAAPGYKPDYVALTAKEARDVVVSLGRGKPEKAAARN